jgi:hypothetical protein
MMRGTYAWFGLSLSVAVLAYGFLVIAGTA